MMHANIHGCASNLHEGVKNLMMAWTQTRNAWRDIKAQEFEQAYLESLPGDAARAVAVMGEIDALLKKVRQDCE
jgi:hypothetical protein